MAEAAIAESPGLENNHLPPGLDAQDNHDTETLDPQAFIEGIAGEMGWSPKEKWKGDPDKWRPADQFLKATPKVVKSAKEQLDRANKVAAETMNRVRNEAIADAERRIAEAAEAGDREAASAAAADLRQAQQRPDPSVEQFAQRHAWFNTDEVATSAAIAAAGKIAQAGGTVQAQLEAAEKEVRRRFPELFEDGEEASEPPPRKQPPAVEGGQRTAAGAARKKGWNDLPRDVQRSMTPKALKSFGLSPDEYADAYFKENG